jgi:outer membrane protein assembly factor BamB
VYALRVSDGAIMWEYATGGQVASTPAVADGLLFVGSTDKNVYALDNADGKSRCSPVGRFLTGSRVRTTPVVAGFAVYAGSQDKNVYALNAGTGNKLWNYALHAATGARIWSYPASGDQVSWRVAVADGVVYAGSLDGNVYALRAAIGQKLWQYATNGPVNSELVLADGVVYVGCDGGTLYALQT